MHKLEKKNVDLTNQKNSVIANISHDLKTLITIISGYIDVLKNGKIPYEKYEEYFDKIYKKTEYMTFLINEFSNYLMKYLNKVRKNKLIINIIFNKNVIYRWRFLLLKYRE